MANQTELLPRTPRWLRPPAYAVAILISFYALYCAYFAALIGIGALLSGSAGLAVLVLGLAGLAVWYVFALHAAIWASHGGNTIGCGLVMGLGLLSWHGFLSWRHMYNRLSQQSEFWSSWDYITMYGLAPLLSLAWVLTAYLLYRLANARRMGIRLAAEY